MPAETTETRPWQKTMDFVDGLKGKLPDEELALIKWYVEERSHEAAQAQVTVTPVDTDQQCSPCALKLSDEELAVIKPYVEKRSREAAQAQVTVTPVDTEQHCSPCTLNSDMPPDVCFKLENNKGKMDPKMKELKSSSAGTGLETPGQ